MLVLIGFTASAATLVWDANTGSSGAQDGAGNWGISALNTNWWDGSANVSWNNANGDTAALGVNTGTSYTVKLTNAVSVGGIIFSNVGLGVYTLAGGSTTSIPLATGTNLTFTGASPSIVLTVTNSTPAQGNPGNPIAIITAPVIVPGSLGITAATALTTNSYLRFNNITNNFAGGALSLGTAGNATYGGTNALFVDFSNPTSTDPHTSIINNLTNITVYSNATVRISGHNSGSAAVIQWPKQFTISGDGRNGIGGAWLVTGNVGDNFVANVVLAGDSTIEVNAGTSGQTYGLYGVISGTGRLQFVADNTASSVATVVLTNANTYNGNTIVAGGVTLKLTTGNDRLPTGTLLALGRSTGPNSFWNRFGALTLGDSTAAVNQTLAGLTNDPTISGCQVVGGNSTTPSVLTINNSSENLFTGTLGGAAAPANQLALVKTGAGNLYLQGPSQCAGGYTINGGSVQFGDGLTDYAVSGPITNNATVVFNVASSLTYASDISGTGSLVKTGGGALALNGNNSLSGNLTINNGTLGGNGVIAGPVSVQSGGTLALGQGISVLTISNSLVLAGTTVIQLDNTSSTNDFVRGMTSLVYGGTLVLTNLAGTYAIGEKFKLFDAATYTGSFASIIPSAPGPGLAWTTNSLVTNGVLSIVADTNFVHLPPAWNTNPVVKATAVVNSAYSGTLAGWASDPNAGDSLIFSKISGPMWLAVASDGTLSGTPGASDTGTNSFVVRVTDSIGLYSDAIMRIPVVIDSSAPLQLTSPDGSLVLTFAVTNFDGSVSCPTYSLARAGQVLLTTSKFGLTFGAGLLQNNLAVTSTASVSSNSTWQPVYAERSIITNNYNELDVTLQETVSPNRILQLTFRAYNEGVAFSYNIPSQPGFTSVSGLTEQSEFRFAGNYAAWTTTSAQGVYSTTTISGVPSGCERPLPVQVNSSLYLALGEARLVNYARMKFSQLGKANSLVSSLSSSVNGALPLTTPWRFIMVANSPGQLLENNFLVLNLNDPCALADTSWIKPGKVIRDYTLTTLGGIACVDFAAKHQLQYIEFDAGWYGPENTTLTATNVNVDPSRSPGPLDLQYIIKYAASNNVGVILYVNWLAMTNQLSLLPPLYHSWGIKGIKYGYVGNNNDPGPQSCVDIINAATRICATNQIMMDAHDEFRPSGYTRTYPNLMTLEGIGGDETTPSTAHDCTLLFSRMLAGSADHTYCYFDPRVTNNWSYAYQLAKTICFYSPWQFIFWYDEPTNSYNYTANAPRMITEVPELEFYDWMPTVWDETRVLQASIGQYAVIARRSGVNWFVGAMNANSTRTFNIPLDFLAPGQQYVMSAYSQDSSVQTRTQVRIDRSLVDSTTILTNTFNASRGQAWRISPALPPAAQSLSLINAGNVVISASGNPGLPYSLWAATNLSVSSWLFMTNGLFTGTPCVLPDPASTSQPQRYYRFSTP